MISIIQVSWVFNIVAFLETAMGISFSKLGKEVADEYKNAVHTMGKIATHR